MKLKNREIAGFVNFLLMLDLAGKQSRMRTRLAKLLDERSRLVDEERLEILKELAEKDENGQPKQETDEAGNTIYVLSDEAKEKFNAEYAELMDEDCVIEETEERRDMLLTVKEAVLNCDMKFKGQDALLYDRYCEIVEAIEYGVYGGK